MSVINACRGSSLRRTAIATGVQCLQSAQGSVFISNYAILFLQAIGQQDVYEIQVLLYFTNMASSFVAFFIADKAGRRPLMLIGACVMAACMYVIAVVSSYYNTNAGKRGVLAALFIWQVAQALGWSSW